MNDATYDQLSAELEVLWEKVILARGVLASQKNAEDAIFTRHGVSFADYQTDLERRVDTTLGLRSRRLWCAVRSQREVL